MKHLNFSTLISGLMTLLLSILLIGCSEESIMENGYDELNDSPGRLKSTTDFHDQIGGMTIFFHESIPRTYKFMQADGLDRKIVPVDLIAPDWLPSKKKIVFQRSSKIYVVNTDGTGEKRLTDDFSNSGAIWSPNGQKILFIRYLDELRYSDIFLMNSDGSDKTNLTNNPGSYSFISWSPNGQKIVFRYKPGESPVSEEEIYTMNSDGSQLCRLTNNSDREYRPKWSRNGQQILYFGETPGSGISDIHVMNADGSGQVNLTKSESRNHMPQWSPNGRHIAFRSNRYGPWDIFVMKSDGSELRRLTFNNESSNIWFFWTPGGQHILFHSRGESGKLELKAVDIETTEQISIAELEGGRVWELAPGIRIPKSN